MAKKLKKIELVSGTTDYLAVNSPRVAKLMRGSKLMLNSQEFRSTTGRLGSFWRLIWFMLRSVIFRIPGKKTSGDVLEFEQPCAVTIHAEGECERFEHVQKIEIKKSEKALKVIEF